MLPRVLVHVSRLGLDENTTNTLPTAASFCKENIWTKSLQLALMGQVLPVIQSKFLDEDGISSKCGESCKMHRHHDKNVLMAR